MSTYDNQILLDLLAAYTDPPAIVEPPRTFDVLIVVASPRGSDGAAW